MILAGAETKNESHSKRLRRFQPRRTAAISQTALTAPEWCGRGRGDQAVYALNANDAPSGTRARSLVDCAVA
jgi:hypothetical protein